MENETNTKSNELQQISAFSLKQLPVIEQNLIAIGAQIDAKLAELNLENQIATEDTVQSLKKTKAELNKLFTAFDEERKEIKKLILEPYNIINEQYEQQIASKLKNANEVLSKTIIEYDLKIKQDKQNVLIQYFNELKTLYNIDWLAWEQMGIDIKLSTTEKQYKKDIMDFFRTTNEALNMINTQEYAAEILVEYKKTLNASNAITLVKQRKEAEKLEKERLLNHRNINRRNNLKNLGFVFNAESDIFYFNDLLISRNDLETLDNEKWNKRYVEFESAIAASQPSETHSVVSAPTQVSHSAPIPAAAPQQIEPIKTACFEVKATMTVLQKLSAFLKENGIEYRNIKEYKKD